MTTVSISWIDDSNAASRGYDDPRYSEGAWVLEEDGSFVADLPRATKDAATDGWPASAAQAKYEAKCFATQGEDWTWEPDSAYSPPRDFTASRS